jgi:hypothetical protein
MHKTRILVVATVLAGSAMAQANTVAGLDGRLSAIASPTYFGRRGAAYPDGEIGMAFSNTMCNPGSVVIPWAQAMSTNHPKFGFLFARYSGDRMVQINDRRSYCKHAFLSTNFSGACGTCINPGTNQLMGLNCSDTYGASNNGDRYWLGPADEIDPWLGTWVAVGSYFDRGDPDVGPPFNTDGIRSLTSGTSGVFTDPVRNRLTLREPDLTVPGSTFYYAIHLIHQGEAAANRGDNIAYRQVTPTFGGSTWSFANAGNMTYGSVLSAWPGATVNFARNGTDEGGFYVAVKVTGTGPYHYEYAVHNYDNSRGGGSLRIPLCSTASLSNVGFRDIDQNGLNEWTWSRIGNELVFQVPASPATNPLHWNMIFNFWFDTDVPPVASSVKIDQASPGSGALFVSVPSQVPGGGLAHNLDLGPGCGSPSPVLSTSGVGTLPNPTFGIVATSTPGAAMFLFVATGTANIPLGGGCTQYLDGSAFTLAFLTANGAGVAVQPINVPANPVFQGAQLNWQAVQLVAGGPLMGAFSVSNGLKTRFGNNPICQ